MRLRIKLIALTAVTSALVAATPAFADGGSTIAGAPIVKFGTQQFGNTANTPANSNDGRHRQYWLLPVVAGDHIRIDWETGEGTDTWLNDMVVGTNDYNYFNQGPTSYYVANNNRQESIWTAPRSGAEVLAVVSDSGSQDAGPYDFTAYVTHRAVLSLGKISTARKGKVTIAVRNPDGKSISSGPVISFQLKEKSKWKTIGSAKTSRGKATVSYKVPKSYWKKKHSFRATTSGHGYLTATTPAKSAKIK